MLAFTWKQHVTEKNTAVLGLNAGGFLDINEKDRDGRILVCLLYVIILSLNCCMFWCLLCQSYRGRGENKY